ncbi:non-ribosomal peptide synthetase [Desulfovibrio sp. DV]|uniref:class I adenylate-forming enzyme family protein n=1 Tax=Desulfovibrio sp. DV TaxID=1844708 RepID=UPI00094BA500|nr:class I adenylate-forming enzyme family protein [Desulfovibrio sp. DV]OLN30520.1 non-ribosomal peptide synthetase [Desulfovibrio sp. DV]
MPLFRMVAATAAELPEAVALCCGPRHVTYTQLVADAGRLAAWLSSLGLAPGDRLAVLLPNSIELVTVILAACRAELVLVPLLLDAPPTRQAEIIGQTGARGLVLASGLGAAIPAETREQLAVTVCLGRPEPGTVGYDSFFAHTPSAPVPRSTVPDPICLLVYTSGSTGRPKAVAHTQERLARRVEAFVQALGVTADTTVAVFAVHRPVVLVFQVLAMLRQGGTVVLAENPDPAAFWRLYGEVRPGYCLVMPSYARKLFADPAAARVDHSRLRFWLSGGDAPGQALYEASRRITGRPYCNLYGLTETGLVAVVAPSETDKPGCVGRPVGDVSMRLVDDAGQGVPEGSPGRLLVTSANMMAGYFNDTMATHRAIGTGWYDTGDCMRRDAEGDYWFLGRSGDIIVRHAVQVAAALVADVLAGYPGVAEAVVVGAPDAEAGQVPVAFYRTAGPDPGAETLLRYLADRVDALSVPVACLAIAQWPVTPRGKTDRQQLTALAVKCLGRVRGDV